MLSKIYLIIVLLLLDEVGIGAEVYYVKATGNDKNLGTSPELAWQSIDRVNNAKLEPGDFVLFKRGDVFRGNLITQSGSSEGFITYGAYGFGQKPKILGSIQKNEISDWELEADNIWQTTSREVVVSKSELLHNPNFETDLSSWSIWTGNSEDVSASISRTTMNNEYLSGSGGIKLYCEKNGESRFNIQFYTNTYPIKSNTWYRLSFFAKASKEFQIPIDNIRLMENSAPYNTYGENRDIVKIGCKWEEFQILYKSTGQSANVRLNFLLGEVIPINTYMYIDSCSLKEIVKDPGLLNYDIGNIIFNSEEYCGIKVKNEDELLNQGDFWFDNENMKLKIYSENNPALYYSDIELAVTKNIIAQKNKSYVVIKDLDLRYGAAHGIAGANIHYTQIKDVDFSFIGGGYLVGYDNGQVRFGNGIEFWNSASYNSVERCTFNEVYDAAITVQGKGYDMGYETHHIYIRNNIIKNSEYSFEFWGGGESSFIHDIYFEHNTCIYAGYGWGNYQRPTSNGAHLMIFNIRAKTDNIQIRNNIFCESSDYSMRFINLDDLKKVILDYNSWYESSGDVARIANTDYDFKVGWGTYRDLSGLSKHAVIGKPLLDVNFSLENASPCIDSGIISPFVWNDFRGITRWSGAAPDIGAYEVQLSNRRNAENSEMIKIYSSPGSSIISMKYPDNVLIRRICVFDLTGREVYVDPSLNLSEDQNYHVFQIKHLNDGVYLLMFETNIGNLTTKMAFFN